MADLMTEIEAINAGLPEDVLRNIRLRWQFGTNGKPTSQARVDLFNAENVAAMHCRLMRDYAKALRKVMANPLHTPKRRAMWRARCRDNWLFHRRCWRQAQEVVATIQKAIEDEAMGRRKKLAVIDGGRS